MVFFHANNLIVSQKHGHIYIYDQITEMHIKYTCNKRIHLTPLFYTPIQGCSQYEVV